MDDVYLNQIATAVPDHDIHCKFVHYAPRLLKASRNRALFKRMAERSQIEHRYSFLQPHPDDECLDVAGFYKFAQFPDTDQRMKLYKDQAFSLARRALDQLTLDNDITHVIVTTCTGFYAPGLDIEIIKHYNLNISVERTIIGFMGCYAAINALKQAWHIVRSTPMSKILIVNLELCTLHLKNSDDLDQILSFLIFADGCAASIVSSQAIGLKLESFQSAFFPDTDDIITWNIGNLGFDMNLSRHVPKTILKNLLIIMPAVINGLDKNRIDHWAVHPGGRAILDAVEKTLQLPADALDISRNILKNFGNMSSATIMFVLQSMMHGNLTGQGCAISFGPGMALESMLFSGAQN